MVTKSKNERHKDTGKSYISNINIILLLFFKYQNTISLWCRTYYRKYWNSWNYENACCLYFFTISLVFKLYRKTSCNYSISAIVSSWPLAHVRWRRTVRWALSSIRTSYFGRRIWKPNEGKKLPARKQFGKLRDGFPPIRSWIVQFDSNYLRELLDESLYFIKVEVKYCDIFLMIHDENFCKCSFWA